MTRLPPILVAVSLLAAPAAPLARGHGGHSYGSRSHGGHSSASRSHGSGTHASRRKAVGVRRDGHGRIERDPEQRARFRRSHPCPSTGRTSGRCPGYVVDHVQALKHGGRDDPSNMQWQSVQAAKAKDRWE